MSSPIVTNLNVRVAGSGDRVTISNLIQLYLYDMASADPFSIGVDGKYDYTMLDQFWEHPYLLEVDGEIVGFALVVSHCPITGTSPCWFMAEFFVMRPYRRKSIGAAAFAKIKARHPGKWHVATGTGNRQGEAFWSNAILDDSCEKISTTLDGIDWVVRAFNVNG